MAHESGPRLSVRLNRSVVLRHQCIRHVSSILCRPLKSETSPFVVGQNKAADVILDKQVQVWHKDKSMALEKLNRYQNATYDAFLRLETEKKALVRYSEQISHRKKAAELASDVQREAGQSEANTTDEQSGSASSSGKGESAKATPKRPQIHAASAHGHQRRPRNKLTASEVVGDNTTSLDVDFPGITAPRAQSHTGLASTTSVLKLPPAVAKSDSARSKKRKRRKKTSLPSACARLPIRGNTTEASNPAAGAQQRKGAPPAAAPAEHSAAKRSSWPSIVASSQSSDNTFTTYRRDGSGRIVQSEVPYRRRVFPKPRENDTSVHDLLLRQESAKKLRQQHKFEDLNKKLKQLDKWNPLDLLRSLRPQVRDGTHSAVDVQRGLRSLDILSRAYQNVAEQELLRGLDPNSPEALRLCKYLRDKRGTITR